MSVKEGGDEDFIFECATKQADVKNFWDGHDVLKDLQMTSG
jgi:hypothetical protein